MMAPVLVLLLGATTFLERDFQTGLVGDIDSITGKPVLLFRHADLDADGFPDLVLPHQVLFQRGGDFAPESAAALPETTGPVACDIHGRTLYLRLPGRLQTFEWQDGQWRNTLDQSIDWPGPAFVPDAGFGFARFLHDLDGDGTPEIVIPAPGGLHIFQRRKASFIETAVLDVVPAPSVLPPGGIALWPRQDRALAFPPRQMSCRILIDGSTLTVILRRELGARRIAYRSTQYTLDPENGFALDAGVPPQSIETPPMPDFMRPCRLNEDDRLDFAGGDWRFSETSLLPTPIFEVAATVDGGHTLHRVRTISFRPRCSFVDFDGDGYVDMITEASSILAGGVRETLSRFLTDKRIRHEVRIHFQSATGQFAPLPDIRKSLTLLLDRFPYRNGPVFQRYQSGELVDLTGDFNNDGYRDLLVQDRPERLALYLNHHNRLSRNPDLTLPIEKGWRFAVADVDGDDRSDIVTRPVKPGRKGPAETCRVFLSREREE